MNRYLVELTYMANDDYDMPSNLHIFHVTASDMDDAIKISARRLNLHMLNEGDYDTSNVSDDFAEISFSDSETGQDVIYTVVSE